MSGFKQQLLVATRVVASRVHKHRSIAFSARVDRKGTDVYPESSQLAMGFNFAEDTFAFLQIDGIRKRRTLHVPGR